MLKRSALRGISAAALVAALSLADPAAAGQPDPGHGRQVATQGIAGHAPPCAQCHGENGAGDGSGAFPRLTGQVEHYLAKELHDFAAGTRASPIMQPIAAALSDQDMQDVAAYYAAQKAAWPQRPSVDEPTLQHGGAIAAVGIPEKGVPACFSCHGYAGHGQAPDFPYIGGQYAPYLRYQLEQFRNGARRNSPGHVMSQIAAKLDREDITAVAGYFGSVRPPAEGTNAAQPGGPPNASGSSGQ